MKDRLKRAALVGFMLLGVSNAIAQICHFTSSNSTVLLCVPAPNAVGNAPCPTGTSWCGLGYRPSGGSVYAGPSGNGFHDYVPGSANSLNNGHFTSAGFDSQYWLNQNTGANGPTFGLCNSTTWSSSVTCYGQLVKGSNAWTPSPGTYYKAPYGKVVNPPQGVTFDTSCNSAAGAGYACDAGYYLTTTDPNNPITIQFGKNVFQSGTGKWQCTNCISDFTFYWGSVDAWNTVTLKDASGASVTYTGAQAFGTSTSGQNNVNSYMMEFKVQPGQLAWQSVMLSSSSPAFEFDNIAWVTSSCAYVGATPCPAAPITNGTNSPVPEPSAFVLLWTGLAGAGFTLRRRYLR
jgi:hypothetical protein